MTANKKSPTGDAAPKGAMPVLPKAAGRMVTFSNKRMESEYAYTADQMRAMYLAGLEAAKACVPERRNDALGDAAIEWNACRATTLANLRTLEEGLKEPALERQVNPAGNPEDSGVGK